MVQDHFVFLCLIFLVPLPVLALVLELTNEHLYLYHELLC
jgi:hypothetical protein